MLVIGKEVIKDDVVGQEDHLEWGALWVWYGVACLRG
jgi:hypothetical protein